MPADNESDAAAIVNERLRRYPDTVDVSNTFDVEAYRVGVVSLAVAAQRARAELDALLGELYRAIGEAA